MKNGKHAETYDSYFSLLLTKLKKNSLLEVQHSQPTFFCLLPEA